VHLFVRNVGKQRVEMRSIALTADSHSILHAQDVARAGGLCLITNFAPTAAMALKRSYKTELPDE
jgi:hypothetical protein